VDLVKAFVVWDLLRHLEIRICRASAGTQAVLFLLISLVPNLRVSRTWVQDPGLEVESTLRIAPVSRDNESIQFDQGPARRWAGQPSQGLNIEWRVLTFAQSRALC
jgi:hypothetical protein